MSVMRYANSRTCLLGMILTVFCLLGADPFEPDSDGIYEMKLPAHPPMATNICDFVTPPFDFGIKPRKLKPDFEPSSDSIMTCYLWGPQIAMYMMSVHLLEVLLDLIS